MEVPPACSWSWAGTRLTPGWGWLHPEHESLMRELEHSLCSWLLPSSVICHLELGERTKSFPLHPLLLGSASTGLCPGALL